MTPQGDLILERIGRAIRPVLTDLRLDPMRLEIFNRRFMSIAEEMGYTLQNTAHSVNIKERLDFSCALFDAKGEMVANAPHIPVHLGSMAESVKCLIEAQRGRFQPGDVWLSNSPYAGGTHLPDITVISPLHDPKGSEILFYLASRGHHADIGGITPGSMPANSTRIEQEGALSPGLRIVEGGRLNESAIRDWLLAGPYPARNPDQNIADLRAQIAANNCGMNGLKALMAQYSLPVVRAYMDYVQDHAEETIRRCIEKLDGGDFSVSLDSGAVIAVAIKVNRAERTAILDFSGTSPQQADNQNAPASVCKAAVLYVFRTLAGAIFP